MEVILSEKYTTGLQKLIYNLLAEEIERIKNQFNLESPYLNKAQTCEYLNISNNTLDDWIRQGLPVIKIGKVVRFHKKEIDRWLKKFEN